MVDHREKGKSGANSFLYVVFINILINQNFSPLYRVVPDSRTIKFNSIINSHLHAILIPEVDPRATVIYTQRLL